ncbi:MAG: hypothetical protein AYK23_01245 [Candidatus Proteinoplasmatales archaeon SG8-5]|nr:MAG: hypothetical protein AYK23_01245 [Candidatus Proteinoplasmatales archaeon SG8-5]
MKNEKKMIWGLTMVVCMLTGAIIGAATFAVLSDDQTGKLILKPYVINQPHTIINPANPGSTETATYEILDIFEGEDDDELPEGVSKFESFEEFDEFLNEHNGNEYDNVQYSSSGSTVFNWRGPEIDALPNFTGFSLDAAPEGYGGGDYSTTNVQVKGVDEGDIVKNDAKFAYVVSGDRNSVYILDIFPVETAMMVSQMVTESHIEEIYVVGDILVLIESGYYFEGGYYSDSYLYSEEPMVFARVFDIKDRSEPVQIFNASALGEYSTSRILGDYLYLIANQNIYNIEHEGDLPVPADDIYCIDDSDGYYVLNTFLTLNINDIYVKPKIVTLLMDRGDTIYVSEDNIYLTHTRYTWYEWTFDDSLGGTDEEKTIIHRISIDEGDIEYAATGDVPGHVLNRYSMDEHDGHFRIASSTGWMENNQLFVLDEDLDKTGMIDNIAPGERIYSARFMGDRCYLVTFRQVDPFFVIDLANPENPKILGELKITGYSDYLHPYDENHIIGLGKDTVDDGEWARFQGVKLSLFDVTDVDNPVEVDKHMIIGDRGTDSLALRDPHAFTFSREKNLLVIPITLYETRDVVGEFTPSRYGYYTWEGAYVIHVDEEGFTYKGKITHQPSQTQDTYWYGISEYEVKRSFYIDDVLYTVSDSLIKGNDLDGLSGLMRIAFED